MTLFPKWLKRQFGTTAPRRRRRTAVLDLEPLESRVAPIVGQRVVPAPVMPGGPYDGVALLNTLTAAGAVLGRGSGSLIADGGGQYILTVAHNNPTATA